MVKPDTYRRNYRAFYIRPKIESKLLRGLLGRCIRNFSFAVSGQLLSAIRSAISQTSFFILSEAKKLNNCIQSSLIINLAPVSICQRTSQFRLLKYMESKSLPNFIFGEREFHANKCILW